MSNTNDPRADARTQTIRAIKAATKAMTVADAYEPNSPAVKALAAARLSLCDALTHLGDAGRSADRTEGQADADDQQATCCCGSGDPVGECEKSATGWCVIVVPETRSIRFDAINDGGDVHRLEKLLRARGFDLSETVCWERSREELTAELTGTPAAFDELHADWDESAVPA